MRSDKISYAGIAGAVGGIVALLGVYANWWGSSDTGFNYKGTADVSGGLALAMAIATFAFGAAYVLMEDPKIRRALGALMTICAVILTLACVWGLTRGDQVAMHATVKFGLWVSVLGGLIGIAAGILALRDAMMMDASTGAPMASGDMPMSSDTSMSSGSAMPPTEMPPAAAPPATMPPTEPSKPMERPTPTEPPSSMPDDTEQSGRGDTSS